MKKTFADQTSGNSSVAMTTTTTTTQSTGSTTSGNAAAASGLDCINMIANAVNSRSVSLRDMMRRAVQSYNATESSSVQRAELPTSHSSSNPAGMLQL